MECGMGRNCLLCTCIIRKAFYRSCQKAPMASSKWLDLQTHISFLDLHHFLLPLPPAPAPVLPSSANGKPSTQMPVSRSRQCTGTESSGTTTPQPRPSRGSTPQCPVLITSSARGQGPRSSHTADGRLISSILHTPQPQLASPATPIPHTLAARTAQAKSLLPSGRKQRLGEARQTAQPTLEDQGLGLEARRGETDDAWSVKASWRRAGGQGGPSGG